MSWRCRIPRHHRSLCPSRCKCRCCSSFPLQHRLRSGSRSCPCHRKRRSRHCYRSSRSCLECSVPTPRTSHPRSNHHHHRCFLGSMLGLRHHRPGRCPQYRRLPSNRLSPWRYSCCCPDRSSRRFRRCCPHSRAGPDHRTHGTGRCHRPSLNRCRYCRRSRADPRHHTAGRCSSHHRPSPPRCRCYWRSRADPDRHKRRTDHRSKRRHLRYRS